MSLINSQGSSELMHWTCFHRGKTFLKTHLGLFYTFRSVDDVLPTVSSGSDVFATVCLPTEECSVSLSESQIICNRWSVEDWSIVPPSDEPKVKPIVLFFPVHRQNQLKKSVKPTDFDIRSTSLNEISKTRFL